MLTISEMEELVDNERKKLNKRLENGCSPLSRGFLKDFNRLIEQTAILDKIKSRK